jgi:hypothetical protein
MKTILFAAAGIIVAASSAIGVYMWLHAPDTVTLWEKSFSVHHRSGDTLLLGFDDGRTRLRLQVMHDVPAAVAERLRTDKVVQFIALFDKQRVGYQGQHTEYVQCVEGYKPEVSRLDSGGGELVVVSGYASDRYVPGACDPETASLNYIGVYLVCPRQRILIEGSGFSPLSERTTLGHWPSQFECTDLSKLR